MSVCGMASCACGTRVAEHPGYEIGGGPGVGAGHDTAWQRATRRGRETGTNGGPVPLPSVGKTHRRRYMQTACQSADNFQNSRNMLWGKEL